MRIQIPDGPEIVVNGKHVIIGFALVFTVILLATSIFTVAADERALVLRFGAHDRTMGPGLHFKLPVGAESVIKVSMREDLEEFGFQGGQGARDRRGTQRSPRIHQEEATMLTGDLDILQVGWDVQYVRHPPEDYMFRVEEPIKTLRDISQSVMREVLGDRPSMYVLTIGLDELASEAQERIQETVAGMDLGIEVERVNLHFVEPPAEVQDAFRDLNRAEQDAQRFLQQASREYESRVPRALGQATRLIEEAEGYKTRRVNVATGEAERFDRILTEYQKAPNVTRRRLFLEALEEVLPTVREVIVTDGEGTAKPLPLIDLTSRRPPEGAGTVRPAAAAAAAQERGEK